MTADVGIATIAILALLVSFCGFNVLHAYERYAWIPAIVAMSIASGCGGRHLKEQSTVKEPAIASSVVSFAGIVASYMLPWAALASDFTTYVNPHAPSYVPPLLLCCAAMSANRVLKDGSSAYTATSASQFPQSFL